MIEVAVARAFHGAESRESDQTLLSKLSIVQYRLAGNPRSCITFLQRCSLVSEKLFYAFDHLGRLIHNSFSQRLKFLT